MARSEIIENWPMTLSVKWAEKKNIVNATRCATRLRLVLKEEPEQAKEKSCSNGGSNYSCGKQRTVPGCNRDSCGRGI